ncbi:3-hydroxyacyl-CoA dehydrogenase [Talaromyces proteolyticus]|uniref:3-hydroxyacyl-CoA dehydrogenase n=1 Tax=Talaromyces proteolyticus TaxID=1131652 RepID=A0AAD4L6R1_9EURO|nr:3-hydroxyacyl-CoA dehydrogenase [Talaromyces proteolyticus]KAH8704974.1 3-hydroxyacyl-CoA dehydrogenase [Talaromyces proteolyticus]
MTTLTSLSSKAVTILGAGTQGRRLAFMWTRLGRPVYLIDQNNEQLSRAWTDIQSLRSSKEFEYISKDFDSWGSVSLTPASSSDFKKALRDSWLVVESVPEKLDLKRKVLEQLSEASSPESIIASNSSSYSISEILQGLKVKNNERFVSLHSYWPPETPAIEIMGSEQTKPEIIDLLMEETRKHGFQPFHVRRQSTGYIYNRIWAAIKREALFVVQEGVATPKEVDDIFKNVLKTPSGPFQLMDVVGLDVVLDIENHYAEDRAGIPEEPRVLLKDMIAEKKLGVKTGRGFYEY